MAISFDDLVMQTTSKATRVRAAKRAKELLAEMLLCELRRCSGRSQRELAAAFGVRQPSRSTMEEYDEIGISTLCRIVEALGGEMHLIVKLPNATVRVTQFDKPVKSGMRAKKAA